MQALLRCLLLEKLVQSVTCVIEHHLVRLKDLPLFVENADKLGNGIYLFPQLSFISPDFFFSTFSILDFDTRPIPFNDSPQFVAQRHFAMYEPAIFTISSSHARFGLEGFA